MLFHAVISSPLGDLLLVCDANSLTGLYFTDQRDCPHGPGLTSVDGVVSQPSAGTWGGRATRTLRAMLPDGAGVEGSLFDDLHPHGAKAAAKADSGLSAKLRLLQSETPAGALAILEQAHQELSEYWRGERKVFDVPLAPQGTSFQQRVWKALLAVPCGATLSYGELGQKAGLGDGHGRAVGTAVGSNPISILIPCHRILAHNRSLNGYGGGLDRKKRLLELEGFAIR